jgi:phage terminase Nu1 subunit (DNA packaging protein)
MSDPLPKEDFNRWADRHDRQHGDLDGRLSRDMVPMPMYVADQRAQERRMTELERDIADVTSRHDRDIAEVSAAKASIERMKNAEDRLTVIERRPASMRNYLIGLAGLALTLLGIVVSAYFSSRGSA